MNIIYYINELIGIPQHDPKESFAPQPYSGGGSFLVSAETS